MQTRKRAKSVSFGKKKDKGEKEHVKKIVEDEASVSVADKAEGIEAKEARVETSAGLSATPPKAEEAPQENAVATPSNEFVSDNPLSSSPEQPKEAKEQESAALTPEPAAGGELSQPVETGAPSATEPQSQGEQGSAEELSSTLPPSAFTIQTNEQPAQPATNTNAAPTDAEPVPAEKKRFGLYFLVVAFLSFILGLGAMAGASYLGLVNVNLTKLPASIPAFLGSKPPTPTVPAPTTAPTEKPVDLTAFTVTVLNGSGIGGKAADVKSSLTTAGFKVSSTGNADKSTYTKTEISAKKTVNHDFITKLQDELNKDYDVDKTIATSSDSDATDVTVTLGQPK